MFAAARRPLLARGRVFRLPARLYHGPVQQALEARLQERFDPVHMEVQNESHGAVENESHFHVLLVTPEFEGKRALQQHRLVNGALTGEDGELPFHALRITAKTPEQWEGNKSTLKAPPCGGKGDGRNSKGQAPTA